MSSAAEQSPYSPVRRALDGIGALLDGAAGTPLWSLSASEKADLLLLAFQRAAQFDALLSGLVGECDAAGMAQELGATSTRAWLTSSASLHPGTATATVQVARAVRHGMTATGAALAAGTVSHDAAAAIVRAVLELPGGMKDPAAEQAERLLLDEATRLGPVDLVRLGRRVLELVDPEAVDGRLGQQLQREEARSRRRQYLRVRPDGHGGSWLHGHLGVQDAAALRAVLDPLAAPRPSTADGPDPRSCDQRTGDALGEACRRLLDLDHLPRTGGQAAQVVVTLDLQTLRTGVGSATVLPDRDPVSAALARRWACEATILPAVLGTAGQVLDLGRQTRLFTGALRRALELRDGGCAFPGCDRPPKWCDGHHVRAWYDGGATSLANGVLLCGHHHQTIHDTDWQVRIAADGLPDFLPPPWIDPHQHPRRQPRPPQRR